VDSQLSSTLIKLLAPLGASVALLFIARKRGIAWGAESGLGLRWPRASVAACWLAGWIGWVALGEVVIAQFGMEQPDRWKDYPPLIFGMRVAAIGLVGPLLEELLFRGLALNLLLRRTKLGVRGAVLLTAAAWALMHMQYEPSLLGMIFLDGLFLGTCRVVSGSLLLPIAMHSLGNLYSIWQSTHG